MRSHLLRVGFLALLLAALVGLGEGAGERSTSASPGAITYRDPFFGLPHIYADTDAELVRENGREVAKDRLGQLILIGRVGRGTLYQAFGLVAPDTFGDDVSVRREGYTSAELNNMYDKLPADIRQLLLEYCKGINDTIERVYAGDLPVPLEVFLLQFLGLGNDLFGNATNLSDQIDPYYRAPGGADPERPQAGFQFTPEIIMSIAILQVRNFGTTDFGEPGRLSELNRLLAQLPADGDEIWDDLNFLNDPLAPVSVPDPTTPGFAGLAAGEPSGATFSTDVGDYPAYDYGAIEEERAAAQAKREEYARGLGAWPDMGSYAWMIDGDRSATANPWIGGFPQTGIQTPSIMHFIEMRSAEGSDHRIQTMGMEFVGAPAVLIGQTDDVAWTTTTAQLKNEDTYLNNLVLEQTDALRYDDEGSPAAMSKRVEQIRGGASGTTPVVAWRTHERNGNGGTRTVDGFSGDRSGTADGGTTTSLRDAGAFDSTYDGGFVAIVYGSGAGQMRPIIGSTPDELFLLDAWAVMPDATSQYVAVMPGHDIVVTSRERAYWLEESTTALGFALYQRAESILDIRRGARLIPSTHNFLAADNQAFNGIGTDLGPGTGNTGYWSSGFSRVRQGVTPTDPRLPLDGSQADQLVVVNGTVDSATAGSLTSAGAFGGQDFSPPPYNFRLDNPTLQGSEYIVSIVSGDGYKQTRRILGNTGSTLTLEDGWGVTPSPGDRFEVYEVYAMPEAINPPQGYTANWNNKAATADFGRVFGRQHRDTFILERLRDDDSVSRDDQRQLNADLASLDGKGRFGQLLIPRLREAVDGVGNGGDPQVDTVLAALEAHDGAPYFGRGWLDPVTDRTIAGETVFLESLINHLSSAIFADDFAGTGIGAPGGGRGLDLVQHAIDAAAGGPAGAYAQRYGGDYFNGVDWRIVVRDALAQTIADLGGIPADIDRYDSTYAHPLSAIFPNLVFEPTEIGNRGIWEQIVEVGPTVNGEFIFPLGQSGFIDSGALPDDNANSLHDIWRDWRFVPMLHVAQDLPADPDGDVDNDGIVDAFERWYFGSNAPAPGSDADGDGLSLLAEWQRTSDPADADTDGDGRNDGVDDCAAAYNPGQENLDGDAPGDDCDRELDGDGCPNANERLGNELRGGRRDPSNPWDFFDPSGDRRHRVDDILMVRDQYFQDAGDPDYTPETDRTVTGPNKWNLGPPNGRQRVNDILMARDQFMHDCF